MKRMFEGIASGQGGMQEMMDNMLKHLLSKDVLYEPMKEIAELYPPWLKKNGKKIPDDELMRFESQLAKTRAIVAALRTRPSSTPRSCACFRRCRASGTRPTRS